MAAENVVEDEPLPGMAPKADKALGPDDLFRVKAGQEALEGATVRRACELEANGLVGLMGMLDGPRPPALRGNLELLDSCIEEGLRIRWILRQAANGCLRIELG